MGDGRWVMGYASGGTEIARRRDAEFGRDMGRGAVRALSVVLLVLLTGPPGGTPARAQTRPVDPREIALRATDLPAGFQAVRDKTAFEPLADNLGVRYSLVLERARTAEHVGDGPTHVSQYIARVDVPFPLTEVLDHVRQRSLDEGYAPVPDAPNDGGTASLYKLDGDTAAYEIGFVKRDTIVFTRAIGHPTVVTLEGVLGLAGITSGRYEEALAAPPFVPEETRAADVDEPALVRVVNTEGQGLNLRDAPTVSAARSRRIPEGEVLVVVGPDEADRAGGRWRNVRDASGRSGWAAAEFLSAELAVVATRPPDSITRPVARAGAARSEPLDEFVDLVAAELDRFWEDVAAAHGFAYSTPRVLRFDATEPARTGCQPGRTRGHLYCVHDQTLYLDVGASGQFSFGALYPRLDVAVATIMAHEWAHHVQNVRGLLRFRSSEADVELQADCLAGLFVRHGARRGLIDPNDVNEGITVGWHAGGASHGSSQQRVEAFLRGFNRASLDAC